MSRSVEPSIEPGSEASAETGAETGLLALDVGSSRVKLGWYPPSGACVSAALPITPPITLPIATHGLPQPEETLAVTHQGVSPADLTQEIREWLEPLAWQGSRCLVASVCPEVEGTMQELLSDPMRLLTYADLPLELRVDQPDKVGIDRLLSAVAANRLRQPQQSAVVVSVGTAITVNLIAADGAFEGGAILPGLRIAASSLRAGTSTLPQLPTTTPATIPATIFDAPPDAVGKSTTAAIKAGLYWGAVGAIRLLAQLQTVNNDYPPQLLVTGGDAELLAEHLVVDGTPARHVPHMVLAGIAITAEGLS